MNNYVNILEYALEMEKQGYEFFKSNSEKFASTTAKELFNRLAEVELDHYNFLKEQLDYYLANNSIQDVSVDLNKEMDLYGDRYTAERMDEAIAASPTADLTILRMAYLIERDYAEFYRSMAQKATDKNTKKLFDILATWEEGHEELFKAEYHRRMEEYMNGEG